MTDTNNSKKKRRFNWGWGISIFYGAFVIALMSFLFYSRTVNIDLVDENYYEKDLAYQTTIDRMESANKLEKDVMISQAGENLDIIFPSIAPPEQYSGAIRILRPSEKDYDILLPVELTDNYQISIPKNTMIKGKWVVQIEWEALGESYYFEKSMMIY